MSNSFESSPTFPATTTIRTLAGSMFALSLLFAGTGYAQEAASPPPALKQYSSLSLGKPLKAPRSYILKAACPSFSACCCVIGGYSHCMTSIECAALGGGCTGRC
jgi:hypothetical protein